jgi:hypothetical protein
MGLVWLNVIAKQLQGTASGMPGQYIISRQRVTLFLAKGQQKYLVGPSDTNATTAYGRTTVSSSYAAGTSLSVTALTDTTTEPGTTATMTASDFIGVELDDGTISWTTISAAASSPITLGGALAGAAAAGNYVWWFTSKAQRFPAIESAVLRDENLNDTPVRIYTDAKEYDQGVSDKYSDGDPTSVLIESLRTNTRVTLNSQPTDVTKTLVLTALYPSEDYDSTADDIAFPQEYLRPLICELAFALAPAKGRPWTPEMEANRTRAWAMAAALNPETSTLYFQSAT